MPRHLIGLNRDRLRLSLGLALWLAAIGTGVGMMTGYELTPGTQATSPDQFPSGTEVELDITRPTLLLFAHPKCPCSRATVNQLRQIAHQCGDRLKISVFFYQPTGESDAWVKTPLWQAAAEIPGIDLQPDPDGALAKRFGAETSGHALMFNPGGHLLFSGGITPARGQEGENPGQERLIALALGQSPQVVIPPVFGCSICPETAGAR